jgi:hypothetical protein
MTAPLKKVNLVNGVSIDVSVVGPEAGAARERFTRVFNSVWGRLPASARTALAARWKIGAAVVFLTPRWKEQAGRLAQCSSGGLTFHFFSPALPRMTDDVLAECIVHELAHAFFYVTGDRYHCDDLDADLYGEPLQRRLAEALVRELVGAWGFQPRGLSQWTLDNNEWLEANASGQMQTS